MTTNVAVIGGGITGLSAAFHLARNLPPTSRITLFERSHRVGGWLQSSEISGSTSPLEAGPRTLRPNSRAVMELIHLLDLKHQLVTVPKHHPAAKARFINFPPLTLLPSSLATLLASPNIPALRGLLPAVLKEPFRKGNKPEVEDESAHDFVARRFGDRFAREYLSAIVHGIYATDARSLSVRAAFPFLWDSEKEGNGSVVRGIIKGALKTKSDSALRFETGDIEGFLKKQSMFTFQGGIETLSSSILDWLKSRDNIKLITGTQIQKIEPTSQGIRITSPSNPTVASHVVSTIPLPSLQSVVPSGSSYDIPHLHATTNPSSSVLVINLVFPPTSTGQLLHPDGFGYLIPRPKDGYTLRASDADMNVDISHALLGTIFDSAIEFGSTSPAIAPTRMTLMLGGPFELPHSVTDLFASSESPIISDPQSLPFLDSLLLAVSKHLASLPSFAKSLPSPFTLPQPTHVRAYYHKNCIPTYNPGHLARMAEMRAALGLSAGANGPASPYATSANSWAGRMHVIGSGVGGVSIGDCVSQGREAALAIARQISTGGKDGLLH